MFLEDRHDFYHHIAYWKLQAVAKGINSPHVDQHSIQHKIKSFVQQLLIFLKSREIIGLVSYWIFHTKQIENSYFD